MGWATFYIAELQLGKTVSFRPRGGSMTGRVESGQLCTVEPVTAGLQICVDDIVLCRVAGAQYLHLVKAMNGGKFLIGNNRGGTNGWIGRSALFGKCTKVEA